MKYGRMNYVKMGECTACYRRGENAPHGKGKDGLREILENASRDNGKKI